MFCTVVNRTAPKETRKFKVPFAEVELNVLCFKFGLHFNKKSNLIVIE